MAEFDSQSSSLIKLNNNTILYLREVNKFLALVCILREDNFRQGVIDYNFLCFRDAIGRVFDLKTKKMLESTMHDEDGEFKGSVRGNGDLINDLESGPGTLVEQLSAKNNGDVQTILT